MPELDEKQLVKRAKRGDQAAFRVLMERYKRKVFAIAYGMVRNPETAMDISQEVFIKVHRYLKNFQGTSSFYTWLYRITVNMSIDFIRKLKRQETVDYNDALQRREPDDFEALLLPSKLNTNPLESFDRKELGKHIQAAFNSLGEKHRTVLVLREVEGLSYEEIARVVKINKGTVMSRLHHARRNFQEALHQYLQERGESFSLPDEPKEKNQTQKSKDEKGNQGKASKISDASGV